MQPSTLEAQSPTSELPEAGLNQQSTAPIVVKDMTPEEQASIMKFSKVLAGSFLGPALLLGAFALDRALYTQHPGLSSANIVVLGVLGGLVLGYGLNAALFLRDFAVSRKHSGDAWRGVGLSTTLSPDLLILRNDSFQIKHLSVTGKETEGFTADRSHIQSVVLSGRVWVGIHHYWLLRVNIFAGPTIDPSKIAQNDYFIRDPMGLRLACADPEHPAPRFRRHLILFGLLFIAGCFGILLLESNLEPITGFISWGVWFFVVVGLSAWRRYRYTTRYPKPS